VHLGIGRDAPDFLEGVGVGLDELIDVAERDPERALRLSRDRGVRRQRTKQTQETDKEFGPQHLNHHITRSPHHNFICSSPLP
jgi:hypothetical protein